MPDVDAILVTDVLPSEVLNNSIGETMHVDCQPRVEIANRNGTNSPY